MIRRLLELAAIFLKLGAMGFGGPAVHYALVETEVVAKRNWLSRQQLLDMIGATNLIPGPNSTELAMHVGYHRAGYWGLLVAGCSFILPAAATTTVFAYLYVSYGTTQFIQPLLYGVKPGVLVLIVSAGYRLAKKALGGWQLFVLALAAATPVLLEATTIVRPVNPVIVLLVVAIAGTFWLKWGKNATKQTAATWLAPLIPLVLHRDARAATGSLAVTTAQAMLPATALGAAASTAAAPTLLKLALFFLQVGAVLYGTGYVLIAYLEGGLVNDFGWLSSEELIEAIAIGNFTPGPILSTATFIGFLVMHRDGGLSGGLAGAGVATLAIFVPSFVFVALLGPAVSRLRRSVWSAAFLDAVNAASIGLMAAVTFKLCGQVFFEPSAGMSIAAVQWRAVIIACIAGVAAFRFQQSPLFIVLGSAMLGWLLAMT